MSLDSFLNRWRLVALAASAAMLATAHAFQTFGGLPPCPLCLRQREVHWVAAGLALAFMVIVRLPGGGSWRAPSCWILGLVFLVGAGVAGFHAGAEWGFWEAPASCVGSGGVDAHALQAFLQGAEVRAARCDEAPWVFAGLSMAGWNAVISLALAAASAGAALYERPKR